MRYSSLVLLVCMVVCAGCQNLKTEADYPKSRDEENAEKYGRLTGDEGLVLFGGKKRSGAGDAGITVNGYLWRASLDVLGFMPLLSTDPFGGVIISDWYEDPASPGERFKLQAVVTSPALRADGVNVSLFRQVNDNGSWKDAPIQKQAERSMEDRIIARARELRVKGG